MEISTLATFALASFVLIVVPGPSVLFVIGRALAYGKATAVLTAVGNALGSYVLVVFIAIGLGPVLQRSETVLLAVKLVGAAYLIFLGLRALWGRESHAEASPGSEESSPRQPSAFRATREGLVVGLLNPKSLVFFAAVLPQFVDPVGAAVPVQIAALGVIFMAVALLSDSVWAVIAGTARAWFAADRRRLARAEQGGGLLMVGLGGVLAVEAASS